MPFTYFAHQTIVLPLKWAKPRWFDGTALCIGSMAPDFAYAFEHTPVAFYSHNVPAVVLWAVPMTVLATRFVRTRLAEPLGVLVPGALGAEISALAHSRHALWITVLSALLGGLSHVFLDGFTHGTGWAARRFAVLNTIVGRIDRYDLPLWNALQYFGHTFGTALGMWIMWRWVQARRFSRWNELSAVSSKPSAADASAVLWRAFGIGASCGVVAAVSGHNLPVAIIRGTVAGMGAAALAVVVHGQSARAKTDEPQRLST